MQPGPASPQMEIQLRAAGPVAPPPGGIITPHHRPSSGVKAKDSGARDLAPVQDRFPLMGENPPEASDAAPIDQEPYFFALPQVPVGPRAVRDGDVPMGGKSDTAGMLQECTGGEHRTRNLRASNTGPGNRRDQQDPDRPGAEHVSWLG
jgi:hypothetical protein